MKTHWHRIESARSARVATNSGTARAGRDDINRFVQWLVSWPIFDPSAGTGIFSVRRSIRDTNRLTLKIDRIYERGEVLAVLHSLMSALWKPSVRATQIRGIRYSVFRTCNPIAGHSMALMASTLDAARRL